MIPELTSRIDSLVWGNKLQNKGSAGRLAATVLRYLYALIRDILAGQLTLRAMSLVYTTLLSIVPLIAMSFSVLKGLGVHNDLRPLMYEVLSPLGDQGQVIIDEILKRVDNVKGGLLGGVSLAFFIFASVSMVQKVEESFNYVWHVAQPRSLGRRVSEYLVVLLIGPVVVVIALGMMASIRNYQLVDWVLTHQALGPLFVVAGKLVPFLLISATFTFLYIFIPNTSVKFGSALIGGVTAGFIWATMGAFFTTFVVYATQRQLIYTSFAVAITTLIWLYLNWLVLLVGAQLAFYHQRSAFLRVGRREPRLSNSMRESLALNVMFLVAEAFRDHGQTVTLEDVSTRLKLPSITTAPIANRLEAEGLLLVTETGQLLPARELSRIRLKDVLDAVRKRGETGSYRNPAWTPVIVTLSQRFDTAIDNAAGDMTLAGLLDEAESN